MKKIDFWTPYIGNVGTIKATIHSAEAIKKYSDEDVEIGLFKIHSEWEGYEEDIKKHGLNIVDFGLKQHFESLPKYGIFSRITMIMIMFFSIPKLVKYYNQNKPDVVISYLQGITPLIARIFSKHKPKIILSIQGFPSFMATKEIYENYPLWKKIEANTRIYLWKKIYLKADSIITLTKSTQINLINTLKSDDKKIRYIPNPIIDDTIVEKSKSKVDEKLFLENDIILAIGRYTKQKDFATLIKAFSLVHKQNKNLKLVILGEGEERENLQQLIDKLNMKNNIILYGFVENPYKYLSHTKLFVLSSLWEDQGHTLVEAVYLKVPVLSTKCPSGQEELLSFGKAGYLCNISDEEDMARKIIEALNSDNKEKIKFAYENSLLFTTKEFYNSLRAMI